MERKNNTQNKKRTRDEGDDKNESKKGKKHVETINFDSLYKEKGAFDFYDGIGVFDFPWLKEGQISNIDEYLDPEDTFTSCWHLDEPSDTFASNLDCQSCIQPPTIIDPSISYDNGNESCNWSFKIDDLEPIDCIWRSVIDQPLDIGSNKS